DDQKARLWDVATLREIAVVDGAARFVGFYPDGKKLVTCDRWTLRFWDVAGQAPKELPAPKGIDTHHPTLLALAVNAPALAVLPRNSNKIQIRELSATTPTSWQVTLPKDVETAKRLALSPDGKRLALLHTTTKSAAKKSNEITWWMLAGTEFKEQ